MFIKDNPLTMSLRSHMSAAEKEWLDNVSVDGIWPGYHGTNANIKVYIDVCTDIPTWPIYWIEGSPLPVSYFAAFGDIEASQYLAKHFAPEHGKNIRLRKWNKEHTYWEDVDWGKVYFDYREECAKAERYYLANRA